MSDTFLFAKTKRGTEIVSAQIDYFAELFERINANYPRLLMFGKDELTWEDGFVIRFESYVELAFICSSLRKALDQFESWTILRFEGNSIDFIEIPNGGPLTECQWLIGGRPLYLVFVLSKLGQENSANANVEVMRSLIKNGASYQVFQFYGGAILVYYCNDEPRIARNRCDRGLVRFAHWVLVDPMGVTKSDFRVGSVWREIKNADDDGDDLGSN